MTPLFADTSFFVAFLNGDDVDHHEAYRYMADLSDDPRFLVLPADREWFESGLQLYHQRPDKHWSMTDCLSFDAMWRCGLSEALTSDHHFEQAGFIALLGD